MTIVANYNRTAGFVSASTPGLYGTLGSTRQTLPYVTGPYRTLRLVKGPPVPPGGLSVAPYLLTYLVNDDSNYNLYHRRRSVEQARARLNRSLIKGRAALGITAATANQSFSMIATRAVQIKNAYTALKKGNVKKMERVLKIRRLKDGSIDRGQLRFTKMPLPKSTQRYFNNQVTRLGKKRQFSKDAASTWLEYTFGWVPLVADIHSVCDVMTDPFEVTRSFGTCSISDVVRRSDPYMSWEALFHIRTVCTAGLKITNPNVALLTQLGLQNPLAVAWDIIPFSFVVDWFFKISTFLNRWNDLAGFSYVDPVTTHERRAVGTMKDKRSLLTTTSTGRWRERELVIVNQPMYPKFQLPGASLWLAVTSVSLLRQKLK